MEFQKADVYSSPDAVKAHLAAIIESSDDAIISKNLDGIILSWNRAAERIFGYTADEAVGRHITLIIPADRRSEEDDILGRLRQGQRIDHFETVRQRKDGKLVELSITVSPIRDQTGKIIAASKVARDITERKRIERLLHQERERLQVTLSSIGDGVIVTDVLGNVTFLNPVAEKLTGWKTQEAEGQPIDKVFCIINERTRRTVESPVARVLREGLVVGLANHTILIDKSGGERAIDDSGAPIRSRDRSITGSVLVFRDVTEQRRAAEAHARLAAIVESSDDAIVGKDLDGRITSWNRGAERMFGYRAEEAIGQHITLIIPKERMEEETRIVEGLRRGEHINHFETVRRTRDGRLLEVSLSISPIKNAEGEIVGASKIARDMTERNRAQAELKRYSEELEAKVTERTSELEAFSYSISHDLRAPLRAMNGFAELLQQEYASKLEPEGQEYLQRIRTSATRLSELIQSILNYSRVSRAHLVLGPVELDTLVPRVLDEYLNVDRAQSDIQVQRPLAAVTASEPLLTQCVANLVSNALKFVRPGRRPNVRVWTESADKTVKLFIQDNGVGVAPENQRRIFDLFARAHQNYAGSGIGLAIVQRAVVRMHGAVGLESQPGSGSTFWIQLPKAGAEAVQENGGR